MTDDDAERAAMGDLPPLALLARQEPEQWPAFIRHLDRHSEQYQDLYNQRTACERIFSQAVALGIERPKLRNQRSITNLNTLIYVTLNLRALQRVLELKAHSLPG